MSRSLQALAAILILGLAAAGCNSPEQGAVSQGGPAAGDPTHTRAVPEQLRPTEVKAFAEANPEALLLDVRSEEEWSSDIGHIEGARLIPLPELGDRLAEIDAWKDRPIITVCRSGRRSAEARRILMASGFKQVINMDGGMLAWRQAGY